MQMETYPEIRPIAEDGKLRPGEISVDRARELVASLYSVGPGTDEQVPLLRDLLLAASRFNFTHGFTSTAKAVEYKNALKKLQAYLNKAYQAAGVINGMAGSATITWGGEAVDFETVPGRKISSLATDFINQPVVEQYYPTGMLETLGAMHWSCGEALVAIKNVPPANRKTAGGHESGSQSLERQLFHVTLASVFRQATGQPAMPTDKGGGRRLAEPHPFVTFVQSAWRLARVRGHPGLVMIQGDLERAGVSRADF